jgi:hypothetical protein
VVSSSHSEPHPVARRREGRSFRAVALGGVALAVVIGAVLLSLYVRYIRFARVAAEHVPPGSVLVLRLEVEQAPLYDPVRRHFLPLLGGPAASAPDGDAALTRIETRTGLHRGDLRECVVAMGAPTTNDWVVVFGGIFPNGVGNGPLAEALHAEDAAWQPTGDGAVIVNTVAGVAVGRATDGAVVIGSSEAVVRSALPSNEAAFALGVLPRGPGSFGANQAGLARVATWPVAQGQDFPELLRGLTSAAGSLVLDERMELTVVLADSGDGKAARLSKEALAFAESEGRSGAPGTAALFKAVAGRTVISAPDARTSKVELTWEREEVDQAFSMVAQAIRGTFR